MDQTIRTFMSKPPKAIASLAALIICALLLSTRLLYHYLSDPLRFPINTIKISANYKHISRKDIESKLSLYEHNSFFSLPLNQLQRELTALDWAQEVTIERKWPDVLIIKMVEKIPVARWNNGLLSEKGELFAIDQIDNEYDIASLKGPNGQQKEVLQSFQKLSKLGTECGLKIASLTLHENEAWDLVLANNVVVHLGKRDIMKRFQRFCKAYPVVFAERAERLGRVDLRYPRGMAVEWRYRQENHG